MSACQKKVKQTGKTGFLVPAATVRLGIKVRESAELEQVCCHTPAVSKAFACRSLLPDALCPE